jgi:hypothetical protein
MPPSGLKDVDVATAAAFYVLGRLSVETPVRLAGRFLTEGTYTPAAADRALARLEAFDAGDQLAASGWTVIAVLGALRARSEKTPKERSAINLLCSETQAWLRREIEALRFTKAH